MQKTLQFNGAEVSYVVTGTGAPVMLVHGFAEDGDLWRYQVPYLQQHCRLLVPDLPGCGSSEFNPALKSMDDFADCLFAILQQENVQQCIMLGHSMGGYIILALAEKHPGTTKAFGFVHSTAFADSEDKKQNRLKGIKMMEEYGSYAFIKSTTPNLFSAAYKQHFIGNVEELMQKGANFKKEALQQCYYAMMQRPDRSGVLRTGRVPVLFIAGEEDVAVPLKDVLKQVYLPETSYIHVLQKIGHMGMWEATEAVNTFVLQFIEGNE